MRVKVEKLEREQAEQACGQWYKTESNSAKESGWKKKEKNGGEKEQQI